MEIRVHRAEFDLFMAKLDQLDGGAESVLRSVGMVFKSITEGNFNSVGAAFRPEPWAPKKRGGASNLQASTTLAKSFILSTGPWHARVSSPVVYASVHQFGFHGQVTVPQHVRKVSVAFGRTLPFPVWSTVSEHVVNMNIPARPFMPIDSTGALTPAASELMVKAGERALARVLGTGHSPELS